jgi:hypothetical protein
VSCVASPPIRNGKITASICGNITSVTCHITQSKLLAGANNWRIRWRGRGFVDFGNGRLNIFQKFLHILAQLAGYIASLYTFMGNWRRL